ncbi:MAG: galactose-1-phosphate uridylyltransferase [Armatimonadota bacterium]|nr:MAG: galactose-1-phosphate uridylyltransferase [Armatimonadota bacterium]
MSELRQDIATKRWVIVSKERAKRPHQFLKQMVVQEEPDHRDDCPFCEGNEGQTPPEVYALRNGSEPNQPGWKVRVVPNKFAALSPSARWEVKHPEIFTTINGYGSHEVIIETPQHNQTLATLPQEQVQLVLQALLQRMRTLAQEDRIAFVQVFRNHGAAAGTSLVHPHSQLIATPIVPTNIREEIEEARRFYDDRVTCVYCYMLEKELEREERIVLSTDHYVVIAPFASRFPFELMILPRRHSASFVAEARGEDVAFLADVLRRTLLLLYRAANNPDYNAVLHTAPLRDSCMDYYHWHIEIVPRLTTPAGFELGSGIYITTAIPEETAAYLREQAQQLGI